MLRTLEPVPIPPSVDEHPHVQRHVQQLQELHAKLSTAQTHRVVLLAEQQQLRAAQHEADVAMALGNAAGVVPDPDRAPRLTELDAEIVRAGAEAAALGDALERLTVIATDGRIQVQREIDQQMADAARAVVLQLIPLVEQLSTLNQHLMTLAARVPYGAAPVPAPQFLLAWLEQARRLEGQ